jgi:hypothetical protein
MTLRQFANTFARLAVQLRFVEADEATIRCYYEAMMHCALELVQMAADRFASEAGTNGEKVWFPGTPEWLGMIGRIEFERRADQAARIRLRSRAGLPPLCEVCGDTSFANVGNRVRPCDCRQTRRKEVLGLRPMPEIPPAARTVTGIHQSAAVGLGPLNRQEQR